MLALVGFGGLLLLFWAFGERVLRWTKLEGGSPAERFGLSIAVSYALVSPIVFLVSLLGAWLLVVALLLPAAMLLVSIAPLRDALRLLAPSRWAANLRPRANLEWIAGALTVVLLALGLVLALAPPTGIDVVRTHFTVPKEMLRMGGLVVREDGLLREVGSVHALYLFAMTLGGESLAKLFAFGTSLVATVLAATVSERIHPRAAAWGALLVASSPFSLGYTGTAFLDMAILMYVLAAATAALRFTFGDPGRWAIAACFLAGAAVGVKPAAFPAGVVVAAVLFLLLRAPRRSLGAAAMGAVLFVSAAGLYWVWDGLPGEVRTAHGDVPPETRSVAEGMTGVVVTQLVPLQYVWDSAGACMLIGALGWTFFGTRERSRLLPWLLGLSFLAYLGVLLLFRPPVFWVLHHGRYFGPFLIGFGAPLAAAFFAWGRTRSGALKWTLTALLLLPLLPLGLLKVGRAAVAAPAAVGMESRSDYLSKKIETYTACAWINEHADETTRVFAMIHRPYFLDVPFYHAGDGANDPVIRNVEGPSELALALSERGFTHVLYEPTILRPSWMASPGQVLGQAPFRELGRWKWGYDRWVILSEIVRE